MVDMARKALESLYTGTAVIAELREVTKPNGAIGSEEVITASDLPCRLSFGSSPSAVETDTAAGIAQEIKLFLAPEVRVKPGSRIEVTQNGVAAAYRSSGVPAIYSRHQEINLTLFKKWG